MKKVWVITTSDGEYDCLLDRLYQTRVLCAAVCEVHAVNIVKGLMALAEYKNTIGKDAHKFFLQWNSKNKMPKVSESDIINAEKFEKYRLACKTYFNKRNTAVEDYKNLKEKATNMSDIANKALPLVDKLNVDWGSVSFAYSSIEIIR